MPKENIDPATGLTAEELSEVFQNNPRAYMAVRGAVAEKHLEKIISAMIDDGSIDCYSSASGDQDKDFYIEVDGRTLSLECKNVEVIKTGNTTQRKEYLNYLISERLITHEDLSKIYQELDLDITDIDDQSLKNISQIFRKLPQTYRESGIAKYQYSASKVECPHVGQIPDDQFVEQFRSAPLTIDFQRTRNSTAEDGDTRRNRYYRNDEIDIVGACLFSRTTEWKFLFAKTENFKRHKDYPERYSNKLSLDPGVWVSNLRELLEI